MKLCKLLTYNLVYRYGYKLDMAAIGKVLKNALLMQAGHELGAFLMYKEASHWFEFKHLKGIAKKLNTEAEEEKKHFDEILAYVTLRGEQAEIILPHLPSRNWYCEKKAFEFFLDLETKNTINYLGLTKLAREHNEFDTERFLAEFLKKQYESVSEWESLVAKMHSFTAVPGLIWHLDAMI